VFPFIDDLIEQFFVLVLTSSMKAVQLQQRDLVLEKVVAPKRASCDGNGRVVAAWFVQCFLCCGFLAMFGLAGTVSTPVLDVSVAVRFCWTLCARNLQKAASLSS